MSIRPLLARGDVILISFPFTDLSGQKLRPAVVVGRPIGHDDIVAFIASSESGDPRCEYQLGLRIHSSRSVG